MEVFRMEDLHPEDIQPVVNYVHCLRWQLTKDIGRLRRDGSFPTNCIRTPDGGLTERQTTRCPLLKDLRKKSAY